MLNTSGERIRNVFDSLFIYNTNTDTTTFAEIYAVAYELGELKDYLDEMLRETFAETAQTYGLSNREKLWGREKSDLTTAKRRQMILNRHRFYTNCPSLEKLYLMMTALEFAAVLESDEALSINASFTDSMSEKQKAEMKAILRGILPAVCKIEMDFNE